jgi:putative transposase
VLTGWVTHCPHRMGYTFLAYMPWKTSSAGEQRWEFVELALRAKTGLAELCRRFGISRKTAYKWIARFKERGRRGLRDQTRRAHQLHNRPSAKWLARLRRCRRQHPSWGAPKIYWVLKRRFGRPGLPSEAAISRWLKCWGLTRRRYARILRGPTMSRNSLTVARRPNDVWSVDFKGWFRTGDGTKVDPLTLRDQASRYILDFDLQLRQSVEGVHAAMARSFRHYGLPRRIRVDNGSPFGATGALGLTRLSAWWLKLGIAVEFIEPGHPEQNGAHEQMHKIYKAEMLRPAAQTVRGQKSRTKQWCREYNFQRPHEALGMDCPAEHYHKSRRRMPERLPPWRYPKIWLSRLVKGKGMISLKGRSRFVGEAFETERLGLKRILPARWAVYFGPYLVGELYDTDAGGIRAIVYRKKSARK